MFIVRAKVFVCCWIITKDVKNFLSFVVFHGILSELHQPVDVCRRTCTWRRSGWSCWGQRSTTRRRRAWASTCVEAKSPHPCASQQPSWPADTHGWLGPVCREPSCASWLACSRCRAHRRPFGRFSSPSPALPGTPCSPSETTCFHSGSRTPRLPSWWPAWHFVTSH